MREHSSPNSTRTKRRFSFLLALLFIAAACCSPPAVVAQPGGKASARDRSFQRWIAPRFGHQPNASSQAMALRQLRDFVDSAANTSPLPELSEQQLQQMERAFHQWQSITGDTQTPNLAGVPTEWINQVLSDPVLQMQAQRMLERYARDRNLATPNSLRSSQRRGRRSVPPRIHSGQATDGQGPRNRKHGLVPNPLERSNRERTAQPRVAGDSRDPSRLAAAHAESLQRLFKELIAALPDKNQVEKTEARDSSNSARIPRARGEGPEAGETLQHGSGPQHVARSANRQRSPANSTTPNRGSPNRRAPQHSERSAANRRGSPRSNGRPTRPEPKSQTMPKRSATQSTVKRSSEDRRREDSTSAFDSVGPDMKKRGRSVPEKRTKKARRSTPATGRSREPEGASSPKRNDKKPIELNGLGATLKRIVKKTLKEHKKNQELRRTARDSQDLTASLDSSSLKQGSSQHRTKNVRSRTGQGNREKGSSTKQRAAPSKSGTQSQVAAAADSFRRLFSQFWTSVASVPAEIDKTSLATAASSPSSERITGLGFGSELKFWSVLALVVLIGYYASLASKRTKREAAAETAQAVRMQEILRSGIQTRADVVCAFHHFVLRRQQSLATWWTHRYAAKRLTQSTPHLRAVIQELTSVYEQARYLPPDTDLTREQIHRAQAALRQCETCYPVTA